MGRYRIEEDNKKVVITVSLTKKICVYLKSVKNRSEYIEKLILEDLHKNNINL